jgi:cytidine deaminase
MSAAKKKTKAAAKGAVRKPAKKTRGAAGPHASVLDELVRRAVAVRDRAHAPYSRYKVGAAIATKSGRIFEGCNVENASLGATICAERGAIMQMIAAGERNPIACAVVTGDAEGASPCGICRQVLAEFAQDMPIALVGLGSPEGESGRVVHLADLLPLAFELRN